MEDVSVLKHKQFFDKAMFSDLRIFIREAVEIYIVVVWLYSNIWGIVSLPFLNIIGLKLSQKKYETFLMFL